MKGLSLALIVALGLGAYYEQGRIQSLQADLDQARYLHDYVVSRCNRPG